MVGRMAHYVVGLCSLRGKVLLTPHVKKAHLTAKLGRISPAYPPVVAIL
jgi:hypothetical protein